MEPLSVAASVLAVLGAARRLSKGVGLLKAGKDAPESLDDLLLHLSGIEEVLQALQDVSTESSIVSPGLTRVLDRAKAKFIEMDSLIQYTLTQAGESSKVDRWQWLRKRGEIEKLQRQLDALRNDLTALISTHNLATLQRVSIHTEESWAVQQRHNQSHTERLARSEAAFAFLCNKIEESSATQRELTRALGEFRVTRLKPWIDQEPVASAETTMTLSDNLQMGLRMNSRSEFRIQTLLPLRKCPQGCPCVCHEIRRIKLPSTTSALFGSGSFRYRGFPFSRTACNYQPCKRAVGPLIVINYFLPTWLSRTMIYAWFTSAPLCPPELLIRTYQVVPNNNFLFTAVSQGDLETLRNAFATGNFSPYVVACGSEGPHYISDGDSLLHLAVRSRAMEASFILSFLLSIGLDPKLTNSKGISALEYYINIIALNDPKYPWPLRIDAFPAELLNDQCEKKGFSEIHKIVLGFSYKDLDTEIGSCPEALDGVDSYGYTPLYYAIHSGNSDHVRVLVSHGVDIPRHLFWTAVESGNCASTQLFLGRGLRPNDLVPSPHTLSFLVFEYYISSYGNRTSEIDRLLIDYGFDFSAGVTQGITALMACCHWRSAYGGIKRMKSLLEHGIDPEIKDQYGRTAIHHALRNHNVPAFEMLIKYGARLDARTSKGETILHMAVEHIKEVAMVHALSKAGIMQLDLDAPRDDGEIAFNLLRRRAAESRFCYRIRLPRLKMDESYIGLHVPVIQAFESLFQEIQEHQGVPLEDRYPPLAFAPPGEVIAAEPAEDTYLSSDDNIYESYGDSYPTWSDDAIYQLSEEIDHPTNHNSNKPMCAPPGAWPE